MDIQKEIEQFRKTLASNSDPVRAVGSKKYLKSRYRHLGVKTPVLRTMAKNWVIRNHQMSFDDVTELSNVLWNSDCHEEKNLAIFILAYRKRDLTPEYLPLLEQMAAESTTWAYLDGIATWLIGSMLPKYSKEVYIRMKTWIRSPNFWLRRTAILAQIPLLRRGNGNFDLHKSLITSQLNEEADWNSEERFFIRKAIGWSLRELSQSKPELVYGFVKEHASQMSGLTFREATRKLPTKMREELKSIKNKQK